MDTYAVPYSAFIIGFFELIAIAWVYGFDKHMKSVQKMMGFALAPYNYWKILFKYAVPVTIVVMLAAILARLEPMKYNNYQYPVWADSIGWAMTLSSVCLIPLYMLYQLISVWVGKKTYRQIFLPEDETKDDAKFNIPVSEDSRARLAISTITTSNLKGQTNHAFDSVETGHNDTKKHQKGGV